jgi:K+-transporting ATPase ATPase A chain
LLLALLLATAVPLGLFIAQLAEGRRTLLHPILSPIERGFYRLAGVDPAREMGWKEYAFALMLFNALCFLVHYALLRWQAFLPFNARGLGAVSPQLSFNTAISFVSNTSWQAYVPEATMAHGSQMLGLTVHSFLSAASGIAVALAAKPKMPESAGTFPTHGPLFIGLMIGVILAIGGLEYVPALCPGPVAEHYKLLIGTVF